MAAQDAAVDSMVESAVDTVRDREIGVEQEHLDRVYRRLEEKIHEAEFLMHDAAQRGHVGTPGALAERDAQVFRAGIHLNRLNNEFEDFLFGRIDLLRGKDGQKGPDGAYTSIEPADDAVGGDNTADIGETLHIGRIGVLDSDYAPLVIDWRAPAAAPFYRSTPVDPGRVVRRRVIRSKGRRVLGVEDDLMRPELSATLDGAELPVVGDGALMAALGQARSHTMRDIVASIQAEQDMVIRAPAASVTYVEGGPGTGKTAVALHRAAYLLYQDRRRYAGGILIVSPTPLLVAYTEGVLPSLGEEGQVAIRAVGNLVDGAEATAYDDPAVARVKGSSRMLKVLRKAARGALEMPPPAPSAQLAFGEEPERGTQRPAGTPTRLRVVAFGRRLELEADELQRIRHNVLGGTAPVNLLRPRARRLLLDALYAKSGNGTRAASSSLGDPELAAELRSSFDEDVASEDAFISFLDAWWPELTPRGVLTAMADERRLGRWARRILNPAEVRRLARSLRRDALSVHDVALLDELQTLLGTPARPKRKRELDPLDQLTGLEELMPQREESQRERAERLAQERTEYAHVIVDEAQDLTPMQWRMVGRRGRRRHLDGRRRPGAVLVVVPGRGGRGPRRGARHPPAPPLPAHRQLPQPGRDRRAGGQGAGAGDARHAVSVRGPLHGRAAAFRRGTGRGSGQGRTGRGAAPARPGRRHGGRCGRDEPARAGGALARRARRTGGRARLPGGEGPRVRRDGGRLPGGDRGRVPGRAARAVRGADPGDPAADGGLRPSATSRTRTVFRTCCGTESESRVRLMESQPAMRESGSGVVC